MTTPTPPLQPQRPPETSDSQTKQALFGLNPDELQQLTSGRPAYTARQMAEWLYKKGITDIDQMSNLPAAFRKKLKETHVVGLHPPLETQRSADGTRKYLFEVSGSGHVEAVYIPEGKRHTLCLSTQAGCRMGCRFCMTGRQGFQAQLSAGEILNQLQSLPEKDLLTNLVYMGMGEPLDNLYEVLKSLEILTASYGYAMSPRRITISTIGLLPALQDLLEKSSCHVALSLHSPFPQERLQLIPAEAMHPLSALMEVIRSVPMEKQRRISFEYIVFEGLNHSSRHVKELSRLLHGIRCRINLLAWHPLPGSSLRAPTENTIHSFQKALTAKGLLTTIRKSRGLDIAAACGLLSTISKEQKNTTP